MEKTVNRVKRLEAAFWTARQCADYLGCSTGAIWLWKRAGKLPFYAQGRVVRFKREDIDRLMSRGPTNALPARAARASR